MAGTSAAPGHLIEQLLEKYHYLLVEIAKPGANWQSISREIVFTRDRIQAALRESRNYDPAVLSQLSALDKTLRRSRKLLHSESSDFEYLRSVANPPKSNWWWYPPPPSTAWTVISLFFLTLSVSILADFTRRLLNSGPDEIGLLAIAVQALFAVGATSTFTAAGHDSMQTILSWLGITRSHQPAIKLGITAVLLIVMFCAWKYLPSRLSLYYNDSTFKQQPPDPSAARTNYTRAINLDSSDVYAHFNLGSLYEQSYEYDKAADEYRRTIVIDPNHVRAYSNLSRLLLMQNDVLGALQVADSAVKLPPEGRPDDAQVAAGLYRNRALAEFLLGFNDQAEADAKTGSAKHAAAAAPYCVLAKVYAKEGKVGDARKAWQDFMSRYGTDILQAKPEPDCIHLAQEALHEAR